MSGPLAERDTAIEPGRGVLEALDRFHALAGQAVTSPYALDRPLDARDQSLLEDILFAMRLPGGSARTHEVFRRALAELANEHLRETSREPGCPDDSHILL